MTHSQVELGYTLTFYGWLPLCFIMFIYMMYRVYKTLSKKKIIREGTLADRHTITAMVLWFSIPAISLLIVMTVPVFYFNYLVKQENYCLDVIRVNKIKTTNNQFLQERCGRFELNELIKRVNK